MEGCSMTKKDKGTKKKNNKLKYFIIFILFIGIGIGLGVFGTTKFLEYKNEMNFKISMAD